MTHKQQIAGTSVANDLNSNRVVNGSKLQKEGHASHYLPNLAVKQSKTVSKRCTNHFYACPTFRV